MNFGDLHSSTGQDEKITLTGFAIKKLDSLRKWAMFFAVLGFIFIGLGILSMIGFTFFGFSEALQPQQMPNQMPITALKSMNIIGTLIIIAIYFFPVLYMYRFSVRTKKAIMENSSDSFELAIQALNSHFQFMGILTIIFLVIYVFFIGIFVIFGTMFT
ncbi:MAG TPA: hypothetical protein VJ939_06510 [Bacteroidales bacterium]|nr:hypothetical protein [Bacteroidales bacterium]